MMYCDVCGVKLFNDKAPGMLSFEGSYNATRDK
jgi:hypothetical protein